MGVSVWRSMNELLLGREITAGPVMLREAYRKLRSIRNGQWFGSFF